MSTVDSLVFSLSASVLHARDSSTTECYTEQFSDSSYHSSSGIISRGIPFVTTSDVSRDPSVAYFYQYLGGGTTTDPLPTTDGVVAGCPVVLPVRVQSRAQSKSTPLPMVCPTTT